MIPIMVIEILYNHYKIPSITIATILTTLIL